MVLRLCVQKNDSYWCHPFFVYGTVINVPMYKNPLNSIFSILLSGFKIVSRILCVVKLTLTMSVFFFKRIMKDADDCFVYEIRFGGVNFPANGPVMQKKTMQWEPSTETIYVRDGMLKGDLHMALLLEGGVHYRCDLKTTYK